LIIKEETLMQRCWEIRLMLTQTRRSKRDLTYSGNLLNTPLTQQILCVCWRRITQDKFIER
jgi:hypothetical protein